MQGFFSIRIISFQQSTASIMLFFIVSRHYLQPGDSLHQSIVGLWPTLTENLSRRVYLLNLKKGCRFFDISIDDIRTHRDIDHLAQKTADLMRLGDRPAFSLQRILEHENGVKVLFLPLEEGSAISTVHPEIGAIVVINFRETPWRRNYDLAHELFHLITWKAVTQENLEKKSFFEEVEKKADRFASVLLMPEREVRKIVEEIQETQETFTYSDIIENAVYFGVSAQAFIYRLFHLGYIDWHHAQAIAQDESLKEMSRHRRISEREEAPLPERLYFLAVRCLRKGLISRGKFADMTGVERHDIDDFIETHGFLAKEGSTIEIMASRC